MAASAPTWTSAPPPSGPRSMATASGTRPSKCRAPRDPPSPPSPRPPPAAGAIAAQYLAMTQATAADVRRYVVGGKSTDTFGRVLVHARDQHIIVDGPVQNGCPGEA